MHAFKGVQVTLTYIICLIKRSILFLINAVLGANRLNPLS